MENKFSTSKKQRILTLISKLDQGQNVSERDMRSVLTQNDYKKYKEDWEKEKQNRTFIKPVKIKKYEKLLTKACLAYSKMDIYSAKTFKRIEVLHKLVTNVDIAFHSAYEFIQEACESNPEIRLWLDRDPFDEFAQSSSPSSIPRVIGAKSNECLRKIKSPYPTYRKRQIKEIALHAAIKNHINMDSECEFENLYLSKNRTQKLDLYDFKV
jgi:hypothetical protein